MSRRCRTHQVIHPKILYFGTPVVLVSTLNEDGTANLAPMSSAWWLGWSCMLGLDETSKTTENLRRERQCVLNLPSANLVDAVDRLALLTGSCVVPEHKKRRRYRYEPEKFAAARLTSMPADLVRPPRVAECAIQLEALVERIHPFGDPDLGVVAIEARIVRVHAEEHLLVAGNENYIDPEKWSPLIMNFCEFFSLSEQKLRPSRLAQVYGPSWDGALRTS
jgi:flavin reductase (DIM6/NTAB) family NADH-FMN oxidoreductase RutF